MLHALTNSYSQTDAGHVFSKINKKCQKMENWREDRQIFPEGAHLPVGNLGIFVSFYSTAWSMPGVWVWFCAADYSITRLGNSQWLAIWVLMVVYVIQMVMDSRKDTFKKKEYKRKRVRKVVKLLLSFSYYSMTLWVG